MFPQEEQQYLSDFKVQQMGSMKRFPARVNSVLNPHSRGGLKTPVNCRRLIEDDHRDSRSSRNMLAVSSSIVTGLRLCRRSRNSARVGRSAISLISASK